MNKRAANTPKSLLKRFISYVLYDMRIKKKLYLIIVLVTLLPVIILGTSIYNISKDNFAKEKRDMLIQSAEQVGSVLDFFFEIIINKSDAVYLNMDLQDKLIKTYDNPADIVTMYNELCVALQPQLSMLRYPVLRYSSLSIEKPDQIMIQIYSKNKSINMLGGNYNINIGDYDSIREEDWYQRMLSFKDSSFYWRLPYSIVRNGKTERYISLNRDFKAIITMEDIGVLSVEVPLACLTEVLKNQIYDQDWLILLLSEDGEIITRNRQLETGEEWTNDLAGATSLVDKNGLIDCGRGNGKEYIAYYTTSSISGWKIVAIAPQGNDAEGMSSILGATLLICAVSFICAVLLMMVLSLTFTGRLRRLTQKILHIGNDTSVSLEKLGGKDEIGELDRQFNNMIFKINELIEKEYKINLNAKMVEVELLQEQMNPHLLYNSLSVIQWLSKKHEIQCISDITENLIVFYKTSLNQGNIFVKVSDEICIIRKYFSIIPAVYNLEFDYQIDIDPAINDCYCLKLILQPAVENALMHGIRGLKKRGAVTITGNRIAGERMQFEVIDNGRGMDENKITDILKEDSFVAGKNGFGLYNVLKRIKLIYGEEYGISISSVPNEYTKVCIVIPYSRTADFLSPGKSKED